VNLKIAATPVMQPRFTPLNPNQRPSLGDRAQEVDDDALKKAFEKPIRHQQGTVSCRFCKGPLFLGGDFCEHCGAPVSEAAPPGIIPPKPFEDEPPVLAPDEDPVDAILKPAIVEPRVEVSPPMPQSAVAPAVASSPAIPPARPHNPYLSASPAPQEDQPGLMGRLKGIFKKS
jgi:hypothetical protein